LAGRARFGDLVIVVPGIFGSRLLHNGSPLWGDGSANFLEWTRKRGAEAARLAVGPDDPSLDDLGDGVVPDGLIPNFLVVGRFAKVGGYAQLTSHVQRRFALKLGENLHHFAYDWRRDLRVSARRLATKAEGWLHAWRGRSGNSSAKIILLCHAMGGLVGRAFADIEGGWPSVRAIVTVGTPFLGTVRALDLLYFGLDFQGYGLALQDLTSVARTLTSVYHLLPHYAAIRTFDHDAVSPFEIRVPTLEHQKIERARQFHRDLIEHHHRNRTQPGYGDLASRSIIGIGQGTVETARLLSNGTLAIDRVAGRDDNDGDGVVPRFSAEAPAPTGFAGDWCYVPQTHGMLVADSITNAHVADLLSEGRVDPAPPLPRLRLRRSAEDTLRLVADTLSLTVSQPFYKVGRPVEIRVDARSASGHPFETRSMRVSVRVDQIAHLGKRVGPKSVRLSPDRERAGSWTGGLRASAPGTYRVTAASNHRLLAPFHVCEFFEVDAAS
jgi:hypothetical protein